MAKPKLTSIGVPPWVSKEVGALSSELQALGAERLPAELRDLILRDGEGGNAFSKGTTVAVAARYMRRAVLEMRGLTELPPVEAPDDAEGEA